MVLIVLFFILYSCILTKGDDVCENPVIDALSKAKLTPSEDILIYKGDKFYRYNIIKREMVGEPMNIDQYWPEVQIPITGAEFFYTETESYMIIASRNQLWRYTFKGIDSKADFLEEKLNKEVDHSEIGTEDVGSTEFHAITEAGENKFYTCTESEVLSCDIESLGEAKFNVKICTSVTDQHRSKMCTGASKVLIGEQTKQVFADGKMLVIGDLLNEEREETIDVASDVFGCQRWLIWIVLGGLAMGIILISILMAVVIFLVIRKRKKERGAEVLGAHSTVSLQGRRRNK